MELIARQAVAVGIERGRFPQALKRRPRFVALAGFVAVDGFDDETHPSALSERGLLVGLEDAVFECGREDLSHGFRLYDKPVRSYLIGTSVEYFMTLAAALLPARR
jgi:hypothetical protein